MKFSYTWLQHYSADPLPPLVEIEDVLSRKSLEVEEIVGDILDIKVLPHRQSDSLSHRGLARELCTLFSLSEKVVSFPHPEGNRETTPHVTVEDSKKCMRYMAVRVDDVRVTASPARIKNMLESVGQRSINSIVDITNFVMNDIGQPMHAFDAHKIKGAISVRAAQEGEKMTTLDDKELTMRGGETVIADEEGLLALAGVKGGKRAIVDENTTSIIFESANFDGNLTRKTSDYHGIRTDSSKRYEAYMTSELAEEALCEAIALIQETNPTCIISHITDIYPRKEKKYKVGVSLREMNSLLGSSITKDNVISILEKERCLVSVIENPRKKVQEKASSLFGVPYKRGASVLYDAPESFDCSSLVSWCMLEAGFVIPRVTVDQFVFSKQIQEDNLLIGDLVFTNTQQEVSKTGEYFSQVLHMNVKEVAIRTETLEFIPGTKVPHGIDHVGIYLGDGKIIHTSSTIGSCVVENLKESKQFQNELFYRRVIEDEERFLVTVPYERLDLRIKEDIIEEVGRVVGYDTLPSIVPNLSRKGVPHKRLYYENKIKNVLFKNGFSEIYTYTFGNVGDVEIVKGLASDKEKLRNNLGAGVLRAVTMNLGNAPLLALDTVKVFEFGNVFTQENEIRHFSIGIDDGKKKTSFTEEVDLILAQIKDELSLSELEYQTVSAKPYVIEIDFDTLIQTLPEPSSYEPLLQTQNQIAYKSVSLYPFIVRDIACWTPVGTTWEDVSAVALQVTSPLIVRLYCFDTFTKEIDGVQKTSYAFRIVFQAHDRTLTDEEINAIADKIYNLLKEKSFDIR